jgi:hypothetical protein
MDAVYFRNRLCVAFAQLGRSILDSLHTYPLDVTSALDSLEHGLDSPDPLIAAIHELIDECISDMVSKITVECMTTPKSKRRREKNSIDYSNVQIRHGYPYDMFTSCGGLN